MIPAADGGTRFRAIQRIRHFERRAAVWRTRRPVGRCDSLGPKAAPHTSARTSKLAAHIQ
jgi:hypothetical protein